MALSSELASKITSAVDTVYDRAVTWRRYIHQHPELSGEEYKTAEFIARVLAECGIEPHMCVRNTGVTADVSSGDGPIVALRADCDALPIIEQNDIPFVSQVPGVMHACGHDMHTASLLAAAAVLATWKEHFRGTVRLLFQPSEEVEPGGAVEMIREGVFPDETSAVYGLHVAPEYPCGSIALIPGAACAAVLTFDVTVQGKGGHGAVPEKTVDPIVCASSMISAAQSIVSRECSPLDAAVLTVGMIQGGTKRNIIPDTVSFYGTIRFLDPDVGALLRQRVFDLFTGVATAHGARVSVSFQESYPRVFNNEMITERAREALIPVLGTAQVHQRKRPTMGADDFAYFSQKAPGLYAFLGVRPLTQTLMPGIHNASFLPDESAIKTAVAYFLSVTMDHLALPG